MARYTGAINFKDHIRSTFTPCGTYIFSSSEDFTAVVWNTDTSEFVLDCPSSYTGHNLLVTNFKNAGQKSAIRSILNLSIFIVDNGPVPNENEIEKRRKDSNQKINKELVPGHYYRIMFYNWETDDVDLDGRNPSGCFQED